MKRAIPMLMVARRPPDATWFYRSLTLDQPASDLTDFPVLFSGTFTYLKTVANGGRVQNASGYDITFYSDSALTTLLKFERVFWDATTGVVEFWVKVPTLASASPTVIYLSYGNTLITTDQQDAANVWTNGFAGVWHLPDGTTLTANDSTGVNNGTLINAPSAIAGKIDGGAQFLTASSKKITLAANASLNITGDITISAWVKRASEDTETVIVGGYQGGGAFPGYGFGVGVNGGANYHKLAFYSSGHGSWVNGVSINVDDNAWNFAVVVFSGTTAKFYVNAVADGTPTSAAPGSYSGQRDIGASELGNYWNGGLDEVRIISGARTVTWLATEYSNQNDPENFYTIGNETPH